MKMMIIMVLKMMIVWMMSRSSVVAEVVKWCGVASLMSVLYWVAVGKKIMVITVGVCCGGMFKVCEGSCFPAEEVPGVGPGGWEALSQVRHF